MARKKKKKVVKQLVKGGIGIGVGAAVVSKLPASAAKTSVGAGLTSFASFTPIIATTAGAGMALKHLKSIKKLKRRRK